MIYRILFIAVFAAYNTVVFTHAAYIYRYNNSRVAMTIIAAAINTTLLVLYHEFVSFNYEFLSIILFLIVLTVEFKLFFKVSANVLLFGSLAYTTNIYSKRIIGIAVAALLTNQTVGAVIDDVELRYIISTVTFAFSINTITLAKKVLRREHMDIILADSKNILFSNVLMSAIFASLLFYSATYGASYSGNEILIHYLIAGGGALIGFVLSMFYAYNFGNLRVYVARYEDIEKNLGTDREKFVRLKEESTVDILTGVRNRGYAYEMLEEHLQKNENFHVVFFDLDGLKIANDNFGHNEGDFYLKATAELLDTVFHDETVARIGGDEFLVVGTQKDEYEVQNRIMRAYKLVFDIKGKYDKEYNTSISYGLVNVLKNSKMTIEEIVSIADKRMYEQKNKNKMARK